MNKFYEDQARAGPSGARDIDDFFTSQAGSGVATYGGFRYHRPVSMRGNGFFGRFIKGSLLPIIKNVIPYLSNQAATTVTDFTDNIKQGKPFGKAVKGSLKRGVARMARDFASNMEQEGEGPRRKRRRSGSKKGKLNPGLRRYLEMKRQGLAGRKCEKGKKTIKQKWKKGKKKGRKTGRKRKSSRRRKPVVTLF